MRVLLLFFSFFFLRRSLKPARATVFGGILGVYPVV